MTSLSVDVIARWSDQEKSNLLRLLQDADKRVRRQEYEKEEMATRPKEALEVGKRQKKIDELKQIICELKETYTKACNDEDYDMVEWVEKQQAALERRDPELYNIAFHEIASEAKFVVG